MEIDVNKTQHERRQQVEEIPADALGTPPVLFDIKQENVPKSHREKKGAHRSYFRVEKILQPLNSGFMNTLASGSYLGSFGRA